MTPPTARLVHGKKFMWDGRVYPSADEAGQAKAGYENDGFETWTVEEEGAVLVYTRRVVKQTPAST